MHSHTPAELAYHWIVRCGLPNIAAKSDTSHYSPGDQDNCESQVEALHTEVGEVEAVQQIPQMVLLDILLVAGNHVLNNVIQWSSKTLRRIFLFVCPKLHNQADSLIPGRLGGDK